MKRILLSTLLLLAFGVNAQVTSGRIVYERKTNLKKMFKDNQRIKQFLTDDMKTRIENFELYFTDSRSVFLPIESDQPAQGFMKYLTSHNKVYRDMNEGSKLSIMDMWGQETYLKDTLTERTWKITENKRMFDGYLCRKAFFNMNDTTRIYAWFSPDIVPTTGPEGFGGLP